MVETTQNSSRRNILHNMSNCMSINRDNNVRQCGSKKEKSAGDS